MQVNRRFPRLGKGVKRARYQCPGDPLALVLRPHGHPLQRRAGVFPIVPGVAGARIAALRIQSKKQALGQFLASWRIVLHKIHLCRLGGIKFPYGGFDLRPVHLVPRGVGLKAEPLGRQVFPAQGRIRPHDQFLIRQPLIQRAHPHRLPALRRVRLILPVPPLQLFRLGPLGIRVINRRAVYIELAAVDHKASARAILQINHFRILSAQGFHRGIPQRLQILLRLYPYAGNSPKALIRLFQPVSPLSARYFQSTSAARRGAVRL